MTAKTRPPLDSFAERIRSTDAHAAHHLAILEQASRLLADRPDAQCPVRRNLAAKLERWRYQFLNQLAGRLTPEDWKFADALDLSANELAAAPLRPARATRLGVHGVAGDDAAVLDARRAVDQAVRLEDLAARAAAVTREHFSTFPQPAAVPHRWRVLLYAPLYLSNYCINYCVYCGFRHPHAIERRHLSTEEALREAEVLRARGFRHVLLVAGDFPGLTTPAYLAKVLRALRDRDMAPAIEIAPQSTQSYHALAAAGAAGVTLYQETYDEPLYAEYHARGTKASYDWRLEALDRAAEAGMRRLGLGILLGLGDPCRDLIALVRHGRYLAARFPGRTMAFSLPRIHEAPQGFRVRFPVDDELFVRMYCALRLAFPRAELVLSTREPEALRNRLATLCITQMSAGSCTAPGGYEDAGNGRRAGEQFPVSDHRSPAEVAAWLGGAGFQVAWEHESGDTAL